MCQSEPWGAIAVPMEAHSKQRAYHRECTRCPVVCSVGPSNMGMGCVETMCLVLYGISHVYEKLKC